MRILLLTQLFNPEPNHLKGLTFAKGLMKLGHEVEVLTGFPCYPGGKVYDGYKIRFFQREIMDNVPVIRVPMYPSHDNSGLRRMANYSSLALSASSLGAALVKRPDVVHVYQGPATLALPAWVLRLFRGAPYVYDIQDLWPDSLAASGMLGNRTALSMAGKWLNAAYRYAGKIIVLSPGMRDELCSRGVPREKIEMIYNWSEDVSPPDPAECAELAERLGLAGRFNVVYAGAMGAPQALDAALDAAALLAPSFDDVQFVLVGAGVEAENLKEKARRMGLSNVRFVPRQPVSEVNKILAIADALLIHLRDEKAFRIAIPQKTQAYMAAGRPIIVGVKGDAEELVRRAKAGIACNPDDPASLADAVRTLRSLPVEEREQMGRNGRTFFRDELSMAIGIRKFDDLFRAVADGRRIQPDG